jgi:hypothetical protein
MVPDSVHLKLTHRDVTSFLLAKKVFYKKL